MLQAKVLLICAIGRPLSSCQRLKAACTAARSRLDVGALSTTPCAIRAAVTSVDRMKLSLPRLRRLY